MDGCPTGAIVAPGVVDARRCLAWLVQAPGIIPREVRVALGGRIYGCDDCQEVCPPNRRLDDSALVTAGRLVDLIGLLGAGDDELLERHGRWYVAERNPAYLRRNALVALGNVADGNDPQVVAALVGHLAHPEAVVRAHAVWAARRLGRDDLVALVDGDESTDVVDEVRSPPPPAR
jgi:epoxyqueuosine reductase